VLGFTSPSVSPTNLVFNVVAIPSGVWRFVRERRMVWPLTWVVVAGTLPGVIAGGFVRLHWLPDPTPFKAFVGGVLLFIGARLAKDVTRFSGASPKARSTAEPFVVQEQTWTWRKIVIRFQGKEHACSTPGVFSLSVVVGMVGGVYGIGGGALLAPFFVTLYQLPVHTVAGATLMGTFVTSVVGVVFYQLIAPCYGQMSVAPDWLLGGLFGVGGVFGMYFGARAQRFIPERWIKGGLAVLLAALAFRYLHDWAAKLMGG